MRRQIGSAAPVYRINSDICRALAGDGLRKWLLDAAPGAGWGTLTDAQLVHNLSPGDVIVVTHMCFGVISVNDSCQFAICSYNQPDAAGVRTAMYQPLRVLVGAAKEGLEQFHHDFSPPLIARYSEGARSVSIYVNPNDAGCTIDVGWSGWKEKE